MPQPLIFDADGTFKLAVFTDLHYGERNGDESWSEWGFQQVGLDLFLVELFETG